MKKALFLDRDGVVNKIVRKFSPYYSREIDDSPFYVSELSLNEDIKETIIEAKKKGYETIIITNQPSILKGDMSMKNYEKITKKICLHLRINRSNVLECFHKEGLSFPCNCRKPQPGLILMAKGLFDLDLKNSIMVGDSWKDIVAAQSAGVGKTLFLKRIKNEFQDGNLRDEEEMNLKNIAPTKTIFSAKEITPFL